MLQHFQDPVAEVNADQKYAMGLCLRNIGDNYYSVSLLKVAMDYVEQHPGQMSHQEIDFNLLSALMKKHEILNIMIKSQGLTEVHKMKPIVDGKGVQ